MAEFLSLGVDYLGFLDGQLRNLKGYATLAHELIQNADDAPEATEICFDVCDDALIVENNGIFSDCGHVEQAECPWSEDQTIGHRCDFHRFRTTASGDKRRENNTTGAFGIGFISVYQITDKPELISNSRHWIIDLASSSEKRIQTGPVVDHIGTRFRLPWATNPASEVRRRLRVSPIEKSHIDELLNEINRSIASSILFLRKISKITLKKNGKLVKSVVRELDQDKRQVLITEHYVIAGNEKTTLWYLFVGNFDEQARALRVRNGSQIEEKRKAEVVLAIPDNIDDVKGLFHACLPTQHSTGLPFHINADFYPTTDRKRILFEGDFQGDWNRAAIEAAAVIFARALSELRKTLNVVEFWGVLNQAQRLQSYASVTSENNNLKRFWDLCKPQLEISPCVFTAQKEWKTPKSVRLLQNVDDESIALPVLKELELEIVHPDLKSFANLLREVGVSALAAPQLADALRQSGLNQDLRTENAPAWLKDPAKRKMLAHEINILHQRQPNSSELRNCSIAETTDGWLRAPANLYKITLADSRIFAPLQTEKCFASQTQNEREILELIPEYDIEGALLILEDTPEERFAQIWKDQQTQLVQIVGWFADRSAELRSIPGGTGQLADVRIWPSGEKLHPLHKLVLPGGFHDPLQIADALDPSLTDLYHSWLRDDLEAEELTLENYLTAYVPNRLNSQTELTIEQYEKLLEVLLDHLGRIRDNAAIKEKLSRCRIVMCSDNQRRNPSQVYFESPIVHDVVGNDVATVDYVSHQRPTTYREFLSWLGVVEAPRPKDIVDRIQLIVAKSPVEEARTLIKRLYEYVGLEWDKAYAKQQQSFADLKTKKWLPVVNKPGEWFAPASVYTVFQDYLFSTQANFLDISRAIQSRTSDFLGFLDIQNTPSVKQVVAHVMYTAKTLEDVNKQVYVFLNQNSNDPAIDQLQTQKCLLLDGIGYVAPATVFWSEHPFGRFRFRLNNEFRLYGDLLKRLGVKESPSVDDALAVLHQISEMYGEKHKPLDDETYNVVIQCWKQINSVIEDNEGFNKDQEVLRSKLNSLKNMPVIPDDRKLLQLPIYMYFKDRPKLEEKFGEYLEHDLIDRMLGVWQAMSVAGVRPLSQVVSTHLVEHGHTWDAIELQQSLRERYALIVRVMEAQELDNWNPALLSDLRLTRATQLEIKYQLAALGRTIPSPIERALAYYDDNNQQLFFVEKGSAHWAAIARELAYALYPNGDAGRISPALKEVLQAASYQNAQSSLDELGFSNLKAIDDLAPISTASISIGGVDIEDEQLAQALNEEIQVGPISEPFASLDPFADSETHSVLMESNGTQQALSQSGRSSSNELQNVTEDPIGEPHVGSPTKVTSDSIEPVHQPSGNHSLSRNAQHGSLSSDNHNGSQSQNENRSKTSGGRLRTYVRHGDPNHSTQRESNIESIAEIDLAGIDVVLKYERSAGRQPQTMPHHNPGFDILSKDNEGNVLRYIEVKSTGAAWDDRGVGLTDRQFQEASEKGGQFWLYVVERADSDSPVLYRIQDPANTVTQFLYDDGWRELAESDESSVTSPVKRRSILDLKIA